MVKPVRSIYGPWRKEISVAPITKHAKNILSEQAQMDRYHHNYKLILSAYHTFPVIYAQPFGQLYRALVAQFGSAFYLAAAIKVLNDWLQFLAPIILFLLLQAIEDDDTNGTGVKDGKLLGGLLLAGMCIKTVSENNYFHIMFRLGLNLQSALILKVVPWRNFFACRSSND